MSMNQRLKWTLGIDASQANQLRKTGVPLYAYSLVQELKRIIPQDVRVILYSPTPLEGLLADLPVNWESKVLRWPTRKFWSQIRLAWELIWRAPDLLFVPTHILPWYCPSKAIFMVYDIGFEYKGIYGTTGEDYSGYALLRRLLAIVTKISTRGKYQLSEQDYHRWTIRQALPKAAKIITISDFTRQEMLRIYGLSDDQVWVLRDAFDITPFLGSFSQEQQDHVCERFGITRPFIFFVGRLETKKNIKRLLEAFYRLKKENKVPHQLVLAGMPGNGYPEIKASRQGLLLESEVIETGWTSDNDTMVLMHAAEIFVFPSLYEGFGIPILLAQATNTPLACSDLSVMHETAGAGAVYFDPQDSRHMAEVINDLIQNKALQYDCCLAGRKNIDRFEWGLSAEKMWKMFNKIVVK